MSYSSWLESISQIIPSILGWINSLTTTLLSNYIIVTILGFILFSTIFSLIYGLITFLKKDHKTDFDNVK